MDEDHAQRKAFGYGEVTNVLGCYQPMPNSMSASNTEGYLCLSKLAKPKPKALSCQDDFFMI
jgi:hypothetical protein